MALIELEISKNWTTGSTIREVNWENIKTPVIDFAYNTNRNLEQIGKDVFGSTYSWDNDGNPNRTEALINQAVIPTADVHVTGTWTFDAIDNLGVVDTMDLNGGTIDGTTIGATTPSTGRFTTITFPTTTRYVSVSPAAFVAATGSQDTNRSFNVATAGVFNVEGAFASRIFVAPVQLPNGCIVTAMKCYFLDNDALGTMTCSLEKYAYGGAGTQMALCTSTPNGSWHAITDSSISGATIDNIGCWYWLVLTIDCNDATTDKSMYGVVITYTCTQPLF